MLALVGALFSTGCATPSVGRAKEVAKAGQAYSKTLQQVNALAFDESVRFSSKVLTQGGRTQETLDSTTDTMIERRKMIGEAAAHLERLEKYFAELDALANGDQSAATAASVGTLSDALKNSPLSVKLSDERKTALSGLAGFIAKQVHAKTVEDALRRDADVVAQALGAADEVLAEQARWIGLRMEAERRKAYQSNVVTPFLNDGALGPDWRAAWETYVREVPVVVLLKQAQKASGDLGEAWRNVLRGEYSFEETLQTLKEIQSGVEAITAVKDAK